MNRKIIRQAFVVVGLVIIGVVGRFLFLETPNFSATAAVAVFAGFYLSKRSTALLVPVLVMALSNLTLDSYDSAGEMLVIYAAFVFPAVLSHHLREGAFENRKLSRLGFGVCAAAPSMVFFVTTNFAVWAFNGVYPHTSAGLVECYVQAAPFYQYTLAGDVLCTSAIFGSYFLARRCITATRTETLVARR
ncbi:MAG: DUF6580 family putative transport protein [Pirellulales bacterium]